MQKTSVNIVSESCRKKKVRKKHGVFNRWVQTISQTHIRKFRFSTFLWRNRMSEKTSENFWMKIVAREAPERASENLSESVGKKM